ncbi:MAG: NADH:flavin oxidoreductase [Planctomycetales bacterium]|nr:NADH:flavin oxidoreductase [Planctomycetales bacterium]
MEKYPKIAQLKTVEQFKSRLGELGLELPCDDQILTRPDSPMAAPYKVGTMSVGNRWCIHPMEGWDANLDGSPSELTLRRWRNFGLSGAKLIWGGEAAAVQPDGRANPNQTMAIPENENGLAALLQAATDAHAESFGGTDDLLVGLQLTHSGRFCRPNSKNLEPRIAYHHPQLDEKFGIDPNDQSVVWTDDDIERLIDNYVRAAKLAANVGYRFVDVKCCHGYLLHEFLSARSRPGKFGGDLAGRSRILTTVIDRIHNEIPGLAVGVRLSVFDALPYKTSTEVGQPMNASLPYEFGFGVNQNDPTQYDLAEPIELMQRLHSMGVMMFNVSCGSPYYNPHIQRPAIFPPSDGYRPPEDPLVGVARQIHATQECKAALPNAMIVGTGYSYLQDYLPHVAQAVVRNGWADLVGLGRMVMSYPRLPADTLEDGTMRRKFVCRTFSDCTTAPRNGIVSGCFPLDPFYKELPAAEELRKLKQG